MKRDQIVEAEGTSNVGHDIDSQIMDVGDRAERSAKICPRLDKIPDRSRDDKEKPASLRCPLVRTWFDVLQGYLAHKKPLHPRTLQQAYA